MHNVIIIPGSFGNPYENWIPWLFGKLTEDSVSVVTLSMPTPIGQDFDHWAKIVDVFLDAGILNEDSTVVAHSAACAFAVKYLQSRSIFSKAFISVAGYNHFYSGDKLMDGLNSSFYFDEDFDWPCDSTRTVSFYSDSDPYLPIEVLRNFADFLGGSKEEISDGGHFNASAGYMRFDRLLSAIKSVM